MDLKDITRYTISIIIVMLSFPISDGIISYLSVFLLKDKFQKYSNFFGTALITMFVRLFVFTSAVLVAMSFSGFNINYIVGALGIGSLMLPITLQSPAQDFVCGLLLVALDKIRIGELIRINEINLEGTIVDIQTFTTQVIDPLSDAITDIPNNKLWSMTVQSITRSPEQKILLSLLISNRNNIGMIENVLKKILNKHPKVLSIDVAYTKQNTRGLNLLIPVKVNADKSKHLELQNELYKFLKIELQKYGIIFIDGAKPVSIRQKSNVVTPIIVNSLTPEGYPI